MELRASLWGNMIEIYAEEVHGSVGRVSLRPDRYGRLTVDELEVAEAYRRQGIGSKLYALAAAETCRRGKTLITPPEGEYTADTLNLTYTIAERWDLDQTDYEAPKRWTFSCDRDWLRMAGIPFEREHQGEVGPTG
jgi:GNAT superfamily N-acetyltransferase